MPRKERLLEHYPLKYAEISQRVALGKKAMLACETKQTATAIRFEYMKWRKTLRNTVLGGKATPAQKDLLINAEGVVVTQEDTNVIFSRREDSVRSKVLDTITYT